MLCSSQIQQRRNCTRLTIYITFLTSSSKKIPEYTTVSNNKPWNNHEKWRVPFLTSESRPTIDYLRKESRVFSITGSADKDVGKIKGTLNRGFGERAPRRLSLQLKQANKGDIFFRAFATWNSLIVRGGRIKREVNGSKKTVGLDSSSVVSGKKKYKDSCLNVMKSRSVVRQFGCWKLVGLFRWIELSESDRLTEAKWIFREVGVDREHSFPVWWNFSFREFEKLKAKWKRAMKWEMKFEATEFSHCCFCLAKW